MARHLAIGDIHGCISALTTLVPPVPKKTKKYGAQAEILS